MGPGLLRNRIEVKLLLNFLICKKICKNDSNYRKFLLTYHIVSSCTNYVHVRQRKIGLSGEILTYRYRLLNMKQQSQVSIFYKTYGNALVSEEKRFL